MTKILLVANTDWYLYNFKLSLAQALRDSGFDVVLVSTPEESAGRFDQLGFRHIDWKVGRQSTAPWLEIGSMLKLRRIFIREKPDLVQLYTIKPVLYGAIAARLGAVKRIVYTITGRGYIFLANDLKARLLRPFVRLLYRLAFSGHGVRVIFENEDDRQYFIQGKFISAEKTTIIQGVGVDTDRFAPAPEPDGIPTVSFAGRLLWDKGVGVLVEAAQAVQKTHPLRVVLAGQPDPGNPSSIDSAVIKSWADQGIVEWQGWQEDVKQVYDRSHIVVLPSYGEGVPTVLLEAAACGRAIIASDIPGCRVVVEDGVNGYLVPAGSTDRLAAALLRLIEDSNLRRKMGAAGRERALRLFTKKRINQETIQVVQELLEQN